MLGRSLLRWLSIYGTRVIIRNLAAIAIRQMIVPIGLFGSSALLVRLVVVITTTRLRAFCTPRRATSRR